MAENTIDTLSLEITSSANDADKAIDRLADSLIRLKNSLSGVDFGNFSGLASGINQMAESIEHFSGSVKTADFTRIANGLNKLSTVDSQGVSDASRSISTLTANLSGLNTITFDSQGIMNIANAIAQLGRKTVTQASENIPKLTVSLSGLVSGLNGLENIKFDTSGLSDLVSSISKLGGKTATTAASGNIEKLSLALKNMMATLSTAPHVSQNVIQMAQSLAQLASNGGRVSSASRGLIVGINGIGSSSAKAKKHTLSLAAAFGKFYATYWLLIRGMGMLKKAIDISSDLTEVQNVVDVTFGNMAYKVEELAQSSIEQFGMSELALKRYSSRFQAMGAAMGIDKSIIGSANDYLKEQTNGYIGASDAMADMSLNLTKLTADMASFYNVEQSAVAEDLESIFTGQTRPLREYGLDLTRATLQEWAMKQGLDADIQSMSQAEKTMLRYQYVMANTTAAQGDFARTANTWANQVRILAQNFQQLGSIIGGVLINAFKPFVSALNSVMAKVIQFAQTIANALGKIFGWTFEVGSRGVAGDFSSGLDDIEESTGGAASNLGDAANSLKDAKDEAKELNKYIASWHEVNNMTTSEKSDSSGKGGSGSGGGLGGLSGIGDGSGLKKTESLLDKYKSDIDTLYELGEYIGKVLTDAMNSIDWDSIYEKARNFGKGLADFLNGLISPELFGALGRTIAGAINTAVYAALSFGENFDWKDLGVSIAAGINEFFRTFDFSSLAQTINVWAKGILDTIITAIDNIDWGMIGAQIGTFLSEIDFLEIGIKIGKAIWKAINAGFGMFEGMFEKAPFETAILSLVAVTKLLKTKEIKKFISTVSGGVSTVVTFGKALGGSQTALDAISLTSPKTSTAVKVLSDSLLYLKMGFADGQFLNGLKFALNNITENLTGTQKGVITAAAAFAEFSVVKDSMSDLVTGSGNVIVNLLEMAGSAGAAGLAMYTAFGPAGIAMAAVTGLVAAVLGIKDALDGIEAESSMEAVGNALRNPGGTPLNDITESYQEMVTGISSGFDAINEKSAELEATKQHAEETSASIDLIRFAIENGSTSAQEKIPELQNLFAQLLSDSESVFDQEYDVIMTGISGSLQQSLIDAGYSIEEIVGLMDGLKTDHQQAIDEIKTKNEELEQSYADGKISYEEYTAGLIENYDKLAEITGQTDEYAAAINKVSEAAGGVDLSQFINEDNTLNTEALANQFEKLGSTASEAKESIYASSDGLTTALEDYRDTALSIGNSEAATALSDMLSLEAENVDSAVSDVDDAIKQYGDAVQTGLLEKIPDVVDEALANYEDQSWLYRMTHTEQMHVQSALDEYQSGVIDPAMQELEAMYTSMGVDGEIWASDAGQKIIDSLFVTPDPNEITGQAKTLNENYREIVNGATDGIEELAKERGKDTISGYNSGMEENTSSSEDAAKKWQDSIDQAIHDSAMRYGSPSQTAWEYGKDTVDGFNLGVSENSSGTVKIIQTWASGMATAMKDQIVQTIANSETLFSELPEKIYNAIFPSVDQVISWGEEMYDQFEVEVEESIDGVVEWFSELPEKIYNEIIRFVKNTLPEWVDEINYFFGREIPDINDNVVDLFGELPGELVPIGEDIVKGLWEGIDNKSGWIGSKIASFCQKIIKKFKSEFDEHSPSKIAYGIGDFFTLGLGNGIVERFDDITKDVTDFASGLTSLKIDFPQVDYTIPQLDIEPKSYNIGSFQSTMQMEMDARMAEMEYQNRQLRELVEESNSILQQIQDQGIILDDNEFNRRYKSGAIKYRKQTGRQLGVSY